jgi:hypothetical protein
MVVLMENMTDGGVDGEIWDLIYHNENALKEADVFLVSSLYFNVVSTTIKTMKINSFKIFKMIKFSINNLKKN